MALYCGFQYLGMDKDNLMRIRDVRQDKVYSYELLKVLEFSSARKRMSVILRDMQEQQIVVYCKGADNIIFQRLSPASQEHYQATNDHLEQFAKIGLRTLLLGKRSISQEEYVSWNQGYEEA